MLGRVAGKVVVVTGAAGGQGAAEALHLAAEGATVIATDVDPPALGAAWDGAGRIETLALDVTATADWEALVQRLQAGYGRVDGLVNNAGIALRLRLTEIGLADLERVLAVNVAGALL